MLAVGDFVGAHALQPAVGLVAAWLVLSAVRIAFGWRLVEAAVIRLASACGMALSVIWLARLLRLF